MNDIVPVEKKRVSEEVVSQIQRLIYLGRYRSGEKMPTERELCQSFNVSKTSLREALYILQTMGYIYIQPRNGIFVNSPIPKQMPIPIKRMFKVGPEQFYDILDTLEALAVKAFSLAAQRATKEQILKAEEVLSKIKEHIDNNNDFYSSSVARSYNIEIYSVIIEACNNPLLEHFSNFTIEFIKGPFPLDTEKLDSIPGFVQTIYEQLQEAVICLQTRDSERAQKMIVTHISFIKKSLNKLIQESGEVQIDINTF